MELLLNDSVCIKQQQIYQFIIFECDIMTIWCILILFLLLLFFHSIEIAPCLDPGFCIQKTVRSKFNVEDTEAGLSKYINKRLSLPINTFAGIIHWQMDLASQWDKVDSWMRIHSTHILTFLMEHHLRDNITHYTQQTLKNTGADRVYQRKVPRHCLFFLTELWNTIHCHPKMARCLEWIEGLLGPSQNSAKL